MRSFTFSCLLFAVISVSSADTTYTINGYLIQAGMSWEYIDTCITLGAYYEKFILNRTIYIDSIYSTNDSIIINVTERDSGKIDCIDAYRTHQFNDTSGIFYDSISYEKWAFINNRLNIIDSRPARVRYAGFFYRLLPSDFIHTFIIEGRF